MDFGFRLHLKNLAVKHLGVGTRKTVSNIRKFKRIAESKLQDLKTSKIKKRTEAKMMWGVRAYNEWRSSTLSKVENFDVRILESDLNDVAKLRKSDFEYAMCRFIAEVVKVKDGSDYPGHTLYQMCVSIQKFLFSNGLKWKLIEGDFDQLHNVLDNVMKERASKSIGTMVKRAKYLSLDSENLMWDSGALGEETPDYLRSTVLFLIGMNIGLRAGDE